MARIDGRLGPDYVLDELSFTVPSISAAAAPSSARALSLPLFFLNPRAKLTPLARRP
jgi:hypothetical protein